MRRLLSILFILISFTATAQWTKQQLYSKVDGLGTYNVSYMKSLLDSLIKSVPFTNPGDYWKTGGTTTLLSSVTVNGNGVNLTFGSASAPRLNNFSAYVENIDFNTYSSASWSMHSFNTSIASNSLQFSSVASDFVEALYGTYSDRYSLKRVKANGTSNVIDPLLILQSYDVGGNAAVGNGQKIAFGGYASNGVTNILGSTAGLSHSYTAVGSGSVASKFLFELYNGTNASASSRFEITKDGANYFADHSAANSSNPRWVADKGYVDSKVVDAINDGVTTIAPSENAVFDALALKQPLDANLTTLSTPGVAGRKVQVNASGTDYEFVAQTLDPGTTVGDMLQLSVTGTPNTYDRIASVATGNALISGGVGSLNSWGKIGLTTHVSGILPVANGGSGSSSPSLVAGTGISITGSWPNQTINSTSSNARLLTGTNTFTGAVEDVGTTSNTYTMTFNGLGTGTTVGAGTRWRNTTAAINGTQQNSPIITWEGQGFATGVNNSQPVQFHSWVVPIQAATNPSATWLLRYQINGGTVQPAISYATSTNLTSVQGGLQTGGALTVISGGATVTGSISSTGSLTATQRVVTGGFQPASTTKTANYTLTTNDYEVTFDATSGNLVVSLPSASTSTNSVFVIKKIDATANTVTIDGSGSETIDGALTVVLGIQNNVLTIQSNGTSWNVFSKNNAGLTAGFIPIATTNGYLTNWTDPNANTILGWDDTDGANTNFTIGSGLTYTHATHTLSASVGIGGSTGSTDNAVLRADGTGGSTLQPSALIVDDDGNTTFGNSSSITSTRTLNFTGSATDIDVSFVPKNAGDISLDLTGTGNGNARLFINRSTTATSTISYVEWPTITSTGTVAAGFGYGYQCNIENASGSLTVASSVEHSWTDPTNASEDAKITFKAATNGSLVDAVIIDGSTGIDLKGTTTNDAASAGFVGEEISAIVSTYTNYTTTATYQNITSITLTPGDWDLSAMGSYYANGATESLTDTPLVISTTTASAAGATEGRNIGYFQIVMDRSTVTIPPYRVSINSNTTYYLNTQATFSAGNPQFVGSIRARRIR